LEVERGAEAAFGDTAVPSNYDVPHVAEGLPLRAGGKVWCVSSLDRKDVFIGLSYKRTSSGQKKPNSFFIGSHGQELSIPRHSTLIRIPRNTGIGSLS
jgi:hypothetical protein